MNSRNNLLCVLRYRHDPLASVLGPFANAEAARRWCVENDLMFHHYDVIPMRFVGDDQSTTPCDCPSPRSDTGERYVVIRTTTRDRVFKDDQPGAEAHARHMLRARGSHRADFLYPPDGKFLVCRVVSVVTDRVAPDVIVRPLLQGELPLAGVGHAR